MEHRFESFYWDCILVGPLGHRVSGDLSDIEFTLLSFNPGKKAFIRS